MLLTACKALDTAYHVGEAAHYVVYGGPYSYYSPVVVKTYTVPQAHVRYLATDGYYYCEDNCPGTGPHLRTEILSRPQVDVYREARDINYHRGYHKAEWEYQNSYFNKTLRSRPSSLLYLWPRIHR